jgi:hypothetical protein
MELSSKQLFAVADWRKKHLNRRQNNLEEIQEILGLQSGLIAREDYELDGHFAFPPDASEFDPDYIENELGQSRYEAICCGQKPTESELSLWLKKKNLLVFEEDGNWYHFYLWKIDLPDEHVYFRSLHGDEGILDQFSGPFKSKKEALADAGSVEINPR